MLPSDTMGRRYNYGRTERLSEGECASRRMVVARTVIRGVLRLRN